MITRKQLEKEFVSMGYNIEDYDEAYQGKWESDEAFTQELVEEVGDLPADLPNYIHIDWEGTARDIMMDYFTIEGHYFRNL